MGLRIPQTAGDFTSLLPGLFQTGLGIAGLFGGGGGGSSSAQRAAANVPVVGATNRVRLGKKLKDFLEGRFERIAAGDPSLSEQAELDVLGQTLLEQNLADVGLVQQQATQQARRALGSRGLLGGGIEAGAITQLTQQFAGERSNLITSENLNRVLRRLADIEDLQTRAQAFSAGGGAIPASSLQALAPRGGGVLPGIGGALAQQGLSNIFEQLFPSKREDSTEDSFNRLKTALS